MPSTLGPTASKKIREYLLGNLAAENRTELELRLLKEDDFFEELRIFEDELVDAYVAGRLTDSEKHKFESHFLAAPERQARFRFGKIFNRYLELHASTTPEFVKPDHRTYWLFRRPWVAVSVSAAILFLTCATYWLILRRANNPDSRQRVVSMSLMPGAVRSGGATQRVEITSDVGSLQLELGLTTVDFSTYDAEILTEGEVVTVFPDLKPIAKDGQPYVVLSMSPPASGDYQVKLRGVSTSGQLELLNNYNFRVVRR